jgi:hypothetical protein
VRACTSRTRLGRLVATAWLLVGCAPQDGPSGGVVVRDSAGIAIVEQPADAFEKAPTWSVGAQPTLSIGVEDGAPEYQFANARDAVRLDDGTVVVVEAAAGEIRFYDGTGRHIRSVGRKGEGPGEYMLPDLIAVVGRDSLVVGDLALRRGTLLGLDGTFGRGFSIPDAGGGFSEIEGVFSDGSLFVQLYRGYDPRELSDGWSRSTATYVRHSPVGVVDTIGEFFLEERYVRKPRVCARVPFRRVGFRSAPVLSCFRAHPTRTRSGSSIRLAAFSASSAVRPLLPSPRGT